MNTPNTQAPADYPLWLAHEHMKFHLRHYKPGHNVYDTVSAALASQPAQAEPSVSEWALRNRVQDLLHLLSFANIETPTPGDKPEAEKAMADLRHMLRATPPQAQPAPAFAASNAHRHHVAVDKAALQMIRNALKNDMERGLVVRGEMLAELDAATFPIEAQPAPVAVDERAQFETWLKTKPEARQWNTTDAMFAAFIGGRAVLQSARSGQDGGDGGGESAEILALLGQIRGALGHPDNVVMVDRVVALLATPQPAAVPASQDTIDAARWRYWRTYKDVTMLTSLFGNGCINRRMEEVDAYTDGAIASLAANKEQG